MSERESTHGLKVLSLNADKGLKEGLRLGIWICMGLTCWKIPVLATECACLSFEALRGSPKLAQDQTLDAKHNRVEGKSLPSMVGDSIAAIGPWPAQFPADLFGFVRERKCRQKSKTVQPDTTQLASGVQVGQTGPCRPPKG